ncbi:hypothetical protein BDS110ZK25_70590 [Bradyrhizobium diazoefficiens]
MSRRLSRASSNRPWHPRSRRCRPERGGFTKSSFDGYRVQVHLANQAITIFTRRGHDWTNRFRKAADDAWHIKAGSAIIDGEIVVPAADGSTDFSVLQNEL